MVNLSVNTMYPNRMLPLAFVLIIGCNAVGDEISRFLEEHGMRNLTTNFVNQEVEVKQIPTMPDHDLLTLGVRTIGARLRIRSAARQWLQPSEAESEVQYCFVSVFYSNVSSSKEGWTEIEVMVVVSLTEQEQEKVIKILAMVKKQLEVSECILFISWKISL